jgi:hypothetical protein
LRQHRAIHPLEGNEVAAGVDRRDVHFPIAFLSLCHHRIDGGLGVFE